MKKIALFLCAFLLAANVHAYENNSNYTGNFNVFAGKKSLNENDWSPAEGQVEVGILFDIKQQNWPVSLTADLLHSWDKNEYLNNVTFEGNTTEFDLGISKHWELEGSITPYIGGGLAIISAEAILTIDSTEYSVDDSALGGWIKGGVFVTLDDDGTNLGFEVRYSNAEIEMNGYDLDAGGYHAGIFIGYHW